MPFSKNPMKYPPELEVLIRGLFGKAEVRIRLAAMTMQEATRTRVQMQSYFAAIDRRWKELEKEIQAIAGTLNRAFSSAEKGGSRAQKVVSVQESYFETLIDEKNHWKQMAITAAQLMIRSGQDVEGPFVLITSRSAGGMGAQMEAAVGGAAAVYTENLKKSMPHLDLSLSEQQDQWAQWMLTGLAGDYSPLADAKWIAGDDEANLKELAASLSSAEVLANPAEILKQMTIVKSMLVMKRMRSMANT